MPGAEYLSRGKNPKAAILTGTNQDRLRMNHRAFAQHGSPAKRHNTSANDNVALAIAA